MKKFAYCALGLSIVPAFLVACGGPSGALSLPTGAPITAQDLARETGEVQYLSTYYNGGVLLEYDYPKGVSPIGSISFDGGGECTSGARTFWTTSTNEIAEFKAGGSSPIRTLKANASECAIDPATGDLAATSFNGAAIVIFHKARGKGKVIAPPVEPYFDGYDDQSDLFVDGFSSGRRAVAFIELKKGSGTFENITTSNTLGFPGSVQWDGKYVSVFDQLANAFYRYSVRGTEATLKGTVSLSGSADCGQTWIARPYVYCADAGNDDVEVFKYPAGGGKIATFTDSGGWPLGIVSLRVR